jgi:hypothetical protein
LKSVHRTGIGILCEAESLGSAGFPVVNEAEVHDLSGAAEDLDDLFFG